MGGGPVSTAALLVMLAVFALGVFGWALGAHLEPELPELSDEEMVALMRATGNEALADEYERGYRHRGEQEP